MNDQTAWPADRVERRAVATLIPYAKNARLHSEAQVAQIAESIKKWGWTVPVLIDESGQLIAGHGRVMAAGLLDIPEVPVMVATGWSDAEKRAYVIADNKLALNAGWDFATLTGELLDLQGEMADLSVIGFTDIELASLLHADGEALDVMGEWGGMPSFVSDDQEAFRSIIMHFRNAEDVAAFGKLIGQDFTDKARFLWYPENEIEHWMRKRYVDADDPEPIPDLHPEQGPSPQHDDTSGSGPDGSAVPARRRRKPVS